MVYLYLEHFVLPRPPTPHPHLMITVLVLLQHQEQTVVYWTWSLDPRHKNINETGSTSLDTNYESYLISP